MSAARPQNYQNRLVQLERAIGVMMVYAERQSYRPNPGNLEALYGALDALKIVSWPELEAIRRFFADSVSE
jgi:hypothetical protein